MSTGNLVTYTTLASAELYDPATGEFSPTGSMAVPRRGHTATLLSDGRVLIAGGVSTEEIATTSVASAELYDPVTGTFSLTGSMAVGREGHTATLLPDGRILIAGGSGVFDPLASAELYDPVTGTFRPTGAMAAARVQQTATLLLDGRVLIAGGLTEFGGGELPLKSAELYDPATGTFTLTGSMFDSRVGDTATLVADGRVLIAGGSGTGNWVTLSSAELYDPKTRTFSSTGSMATPRTYHTGTLLSNGLVLIFGGVNDGSFFSFALTYDPATGEFARVLDVTTGRIQHTATVLSDGRLLIAGGRDRNGNALDRAEVYQP